MTAGDRDPALRRFELDALFACLGAAGVALVVTGGRPDVALGVIGGGLLMALSYRAIKGGVDVLVAAAEQVGTARQARAAEEPAGAGEAPGPGPGGAAGEEPDRATGQEPDSTERVEHPPALSRGRRLAAVVKFFTRYALLAVAAYVMLTCFRLHPVGLLAGALTPFLAGLVQVVRLSRTHARRQHP